ncbi:hypothetical protein H7J86_24140 [Mycobacterium hackensackense]|uniref:hypothetical protein n=1 Tax=Mycobacterium hackensackense TaxID=228909 RepID=UPI0022659120|nr:hypothetical protein [Mycobacterium hackensackense]MCV7255257.1 hypothetical protein [Mycobacterium hackensackense]
MSAMSDLDIDLQITLAEDGADLGFEPEEFLGLPTCETCGQIIWSSNGIWTHKGTNSLFCGDGSYSIDSAWPASDNAERPSPGYAFEYAIQFADDGTFHTGYDDYRGEFVPTWTDFTEAKHEYFRVKSCGLVPHDEHLRSAQLVRREVPAWTPVTHQGYPVYQPPVVVE